MNLKLKILGVVAAVLLQIIFGALVFKYGYSQGRSFVESEYQKADIQALQDVIRDSEKLIKAADKASLLINQFMSGRIKFNQQTTQELLNALTSTAHLRVNCVFDDRVMQQIHQAADDADKSATSGIVNTMPSSTAPNK